MNLLYDFAREGWLAGDVSWRDNKIKAYLLDTNGYAVNAAAHQWLSDVPAGARVAVSAVLTGKTWAAGVADADDIAFSAVTGPSCEAIVLVRAAAAAGDADLAASAQRLLVYLDSAVNLPVIPTGGDVLVTWDQGSSRIFRL